MASIKGLELKNVKSFNGHEGECYQGNLYLNGKKIGFWSQDSWGGPDYFEFEPDLNIDMKKFDDLVKKSFAPRRFYGRDFAVDLAFLMTDICALNDREKTFKKDQNKKYSVLVIAEMEDCTEFWSSYRKERTDDDIEATEKAYIKTKNCCAPISRICIYRQPEDFNIGEPFKLEDITG